MIENNLNNLTMLKVPILLLKHTSKCSSVCSGGRLEFYFGNYTWMVRLNSPFARWRWMTTATRMLCQYPSANQWALYISGVRSSCHRAKPSMAANGALSYVSLSLPTRSFMLTCYVKIAQGVWNGRNSGPPCLPRLTSFFSGRWPEDLTPYIYI